MSSRIFAFLKKDFLVESSYKLSFVLNIFGVFFSILSYFFIDRLFGQKMINHLEDFGVSYFSYVLLSMAFFSYTGVGLGSFSSRIRSEQLQGTLEAVLLAPVKTATLLSSLAIWNFAVATLDLAIYITLGRLLFNIDFSNINIASTSLILVLTILSFSSLGVLSAGFMLVFRQGNPVSWIINNLEGLVGGVYFPVSVLPNWLQFVSRLFPITYAIRAIQFAVYRGYSVAQLSGEIMFLLLFTVILLPLSLAVFGYSIKKARKEGSLGQY